MAFGENIRDATIYKHITKLESYSKNKPAMKFTRSSIRPDNKPWSSSITTGHRTDDPTGWDWENEVPNARWEGGRRTKRARKAKRARKTKRLYKKI
jgi:hypothetical protein